MNTHPNHVISNLTNEIVLNHNALNARSNQSEMSEDDSNNKLEELRRSDVFQPMKFLERFIGIFFIEMILFYSQKRKDHLKNIDVRHTITSLVSFISGI